MPVYGKVTKDRYLTPVSPFPASAGPKVLQSYIPTVPQSPRMQAKVKLLPENNRSRYNLFVDSGTGIEHIQEHASSGLKVLQFDRVQSFR